MDQHQVLQGARIWVTSNLVLLVMLSHFFFSVISLYLMFSEEEVVVSSHSRDMGRRCDAPIPGGPVDHRQPAEYLCLIS